jgi:hypothetical protein
LNVLNDGSDMVISWKTPPACTNSILKYEIQISSYLLLGEAHNAAHAFITEHVGGAEHSTAVENGAKFGTVHVKGDQVIGALEAHGRSSYSIIHSVGYT